MAYLTAALTVRLWVDKSVQTLVGYSVLNLVDNSAVKTDLRWVLLSVLLLGPLLDHKLVLKSVRTTVLRSAATRELH